LKLSNGEVLIERPHDFVASVRRSRYLPSRGFAHGGIRLSAAELLE
jgi:hypothetical protein